MRRSRCWSPSPCSKKRANCSSRLGNNERARRAAACCRATWRIHSASISHCSAGDFPSSRARVRDDIPLRRSANSSLLNSPSNAAVADFHRWQSEATTMRCCPSWSNLEICCLFSSEIIAVASTRSACRHA